MSANTRHQNENDRAHEQPSVQSSSSEKLRTETQDSGLGSKRNQESVSASNTMQKDGFVGNLSIEDSSKSSQNKDKGGTHKDSADKDSNNAHTGFCSSSHLHKEPRVKSEPTVNESKSHEKGEDKNAQVDKGKDKAAGDASKNNSEKDPQSIMNDPKASPEDKIRAATKMAESGHKSFTGDDGRKYSIHTQKYGNREAAVVSTTDRHGKFMPVLRGLVDKHGNVSHQKHHDGSKASFGGDRASNSLKNSSVLETNSTDTRGKEGHEKEQQSQPRSSEGDENKEREDGLKKHEQSDMDSKNSQNNKGSNPERIWNFLRKDLQLTKAQAAGVMGNLQQESHFNPDQHQLGGGPGYGLAQWEGSRKRDLQNFAHQQHTSPGNLDTQLKFLKHELMTSERSAFSALKHAQTPEQATLAFSKKYERAGRPNMSARYKFARQALDRYGSSEEDAA